jgi:hypothetical protein
MTSAFPIFAAAALLLGASAAQAAKPMGHGAKSNIILPAPPVESSLPPTTNSGALDLPQSLGTPPVNAGALGTTNPTASAFPISKASALCPGIRVRRPTIRTRRFPRWTTRVRLWRQTQELQPLASTRRAPARTAECRAASWQEA